MRVKLILISAALAFACKREQAAAPATQVASVVATAQANVLRGKIVEKIDASQYSYLKLETADGEVWTAVPQTTKAVGETAGVLGPVWMENFKSSTLNRSWEHIAFGTLEGAGAPATGTPGAPAGSAGMFAGAAATMPAGHPAPSAVDSGPIKVAAAAGPMGRTIADVYARKAELKDKTVSIRGKVVKATNGVLGKNWLHLRDGTGKGATEDLTIASDDTAKVGDTVLVSGTVHLDRDLGAGYHYDVLVENAQIKAE